MSETLSVSVGIVGAGSMGGSIARGLLEAGAIVPERLLAADHDPARTAALAALGAHVFPDGAALVDAGPDVVVLAVKPQVLPDVMAQCAAGLAGRLVISIAAGVALSTIEAALPGARVVRAMPNLPVQVRSGATALAAGSLATAADVELARKVFAALGAAQVMREDQLDVSGAVVGTAPAFFSLFVDTLTRAGVRAGLPAQACREMLETTMRGCAEQLLAEGVHPRAYMERVTSPGGTTAAALRELEPLVAAGSEEAVDAALARTRELAEG
ncbi:pyrroline-5-carboxylate reductase [Thermophilibacter sp. ET337]|uniref:pyrroline-5-carboxylate reductase n=1 Tax=Thermophilibacter sp. ET337 TaxID=2973084 RepID=UPI0021ACE540|nr:pyrroline-5-carboxylate reductase [Thermophilibacter sp. ET337]MCR8907623.1 pyrroline-5-carboxylate reductase [Thermophilibacter sp. ET337]